MEIQFSKINNDCMTCAFVNATGLAYNVVSESFETLGTRMSDQPANMFNMHEISKARAIFSKKNMVVVFKVNETTVHAIAIQNKRAIDNNENSALTNRSLLSILMSRKTLKIWSK